MNFSNLIKIILNKGETLLENIKIIETRECDLENIQKLWADKDVMKYVGFPDGLIVSLEDLHKWYQRIEQERPNVNHYSIYVDDIYCGESFYAIDHEHDFSACLDIKLFKHARGKGIATFALNYAIEEAFKNGAKKVWVDPNPQNHKAIALYERLGFIRKPMPTYLLDNESIDSIYMEIKKK